MSRISADEYWERTAVERGRAHAEQSCFKCHPGAKLDGVVADWLAPEKLDSLDAFLATHHAEDDVIRASVIAYLRQRLSESTPPS